MEQSPALTLSPTRREALALLALLAAGGCAGPRPARVVDVGVFVTALAPCGVWVVIADHGEVWVPANMPPGWRPYTRGRWAPTRYGWTWVSDFEWGWAPFHYGRWLLTVEHGWVWVPGAVWGPAWVAWRQGPDWMGWAPLPPRAAVAASGTWTLSDSQVDLWIAVDSWCFVPRVHFWSYPLLPHFAPGRQRVELLARTRHRTAYTVRDGRASQVAPPGWSPVDPSRPRVDLYELRDVDAAGRAVRPGDLPSWSVPGQSAPRRATAPELRVFRPRVERSPGSVRSTPRSGRTGGRPGGRPRGG